MGSVISVKLERNLQIILEVAFLLRGELTNPWLQGVTRMTETAFERKR